MATDALPGRSTALGPTRPHRLVICPHMQKIDARWRYEPAGHQLDAVVHGDCDPNCP